MKHLICLIVGVAFLLSFQLNGYSAESLKIAVVDLQKLQRESTGFKKLSELVQAKTDIFRVERRKVNDSATKEFYVRAR